MEILRWARVARATLHTWYLRHWFDSKDILQGGQGFWLSQNLIISSLKDTLNLQ